MLVGKSATNVAPLMIMIMIMILRCLKFISALSIENIIVERNIFSPHIEALIHGKPDATFLRQWTKYFQRIKTIMVASFMLSSFMDKPEFKTEIQKDLVYQGYVLKDSWHGLGLFRI